MSRFEELLLLQMAEYKKLEEIRQEIYLLKLIAFCKTPCYRYGAVI